MIEDLEGATSEPSRRTHVAALSAAVAAVSLVLLVALLGPAPRTDTPPLAAAPVPSPTDDRVITFAAGPAWIRSDQVSQVRDFVTMRVCVTAVASNPAVHHLVVDRGEECGERLARARRREDERALT